MVNKPYMDGMGMESITRKGWTTKTNFCFSENKLSPWTTAGWKNQGTCWFSRELILESYGWKLEPETCNNCNINASSSGVFELPLLEEGHIFYQCKTLWVKCIRDLALQNCHLFGLVGFQKKITFGGGILEMYWKQMNRHIWFLEMIRHLLGDFCWFYVAIWSAPLAVVGDFRHNLWMINCMYCWFHARICNDLSTSLRQCPGNRIMIEHVQIRISIHTKLQDT